MSIYYTHLENFQYIKKQIKATYISDSAVTNEEFYPLGQLGFLSVNESGMVLGVCL